jgi:hypothetical protein
VSGQEDNRDPIEKLARRVVRDIRADRRSTVNSHLPYLNAVMERVREILKNE